ncbi:6796_t:CDS:2 [Paraglomus brasilianum]|uniref:6796_t:CDS:1 n=1 Tax=Paraglomus brasilianum TaxID=144538 RepID=A0A9N8YT89_9GLOM|nr:6796_t:CDS:2 [Paraglomus brasilianum]
MATKDWPVAAGPQHGVRRRKQYDTPRRRLWRILTSVFLEVINMLHERLQAVPLFRSWDELINSAMAQLPQWGCNGTEGTSNTCRSLDDYT